MANGGANTNIFYDFVQSFVIVFIAYDPMGSRYNCDLVCLIFSSTVHIDLSNSIAENDFPNMKEKPLDDSHSR